MSLKDALTASSAVAEDGFEFVGFSTGTVAGAPFYLRNCPSIKRQSAGAAVGLGVSLGMARELAVRNRSATNRLTNV